MSEKTAGKLLHDWFAHFLNARLAADEREVGQGAEWDALPYLDRDAWADTEAEFKASVLRSAAPQPGKRAGLSEDDRKRLREIADELDPIVRLPGRVPFKSEVDAADFLRALADHQSSEEEEKALGHKLWIGNIKAAIKTFEEREDDRTVGALRETLARALSEQPSEREPNEIAYTALEDASNSVYEPTASDAKQALAEVDKALADSGKKPAPTEPLIAPSKAQRKEAEAAGIAAGRCPYCEGEMDAFGGIHTKTCPVVGPPVSEPIDTKGKQ